jgi:hypothetical protein
VCTYQELLHSEEVHVHPDGAAPVVFARVVELVALAETAQAIGRPQFILVGNQVQDGAEPLAVLVHQAREEWE